MSDPYFPDVIDNSLLDAFKQCPEKCRLEYFEHWKPKTPNVHLHAGGAYARGLEVARLAFFRDGRPEAEAIAAGAKALIEFYGAFECPPDSPKSLEGTLGAFEFYFDRYPMGSDTATPYRFADGRLGVEFNFVEPLDVVHPVTGAPLLYTGRFDQLCDYQGAVYGEDDKTTTQLGASWPRKWDLRCFSGDTELLTASGWKEIKFIEEGEDVVQWNQTTQEMELVPAKDVHSADFQGQMYQLESGRLNQLVTPNHRIPLLLRRGGHTTVFADDIVNQDGKHKIPLSGMLHSEKLPADVQRYIVALQADGCLRPSKGKAESGRGHREHMPCPGASFAFTKVRKAERLKQILTRLGQEFSENADGSLYVSGFSPLQELAVKLLDERKTFVSDTYSLYDQAFLEELEHWDGWAAQYYTTSEENARFVQTVAHTNGCRASVRKKINHTVSYVVIVSKEQTYNLIDNTSVATVDWDDKVYCLSVPSGFVLTRRKGIVSVSGNSQFTGYCWGARKAGIPITGFLVRGLSILKTKFDTMQAITYRQQWQIDEWYEKLNTTILPDLIRMWEQGKWGMAHGDACESYGGCPFRVVSLAEPENRLSWLETKFERRKWDPVTRVETKL